MQDQQHQGRVALARGGASQPLHPRKLALGRRLLKDSIAGFVASIVVTANIISFGPLMFPGHLASGIPFAIWGMLIGSCIGGLLIARTTSIPPIATGIDSPTGIVLTLLSASIGSHAILIGDTSQVAVQSAMLVYSVTTLLAGLLFYALGVLRWGAYFRFVPYFVVCGFLAATGWFLIAGGVRMTTGRTFNAAGLFSPWTWPEATKLIVAVAVLGVLLGVRRWVKSAFGLPAALLAMWLFGALVLHVYGYDTRTGGWYFPSLGALSVWSPIVGLKSAHLDEALRYVPEMFAVVIVALVSLVTKVSSLEVARQVAGDIDRELRGHGIGSIIAAPLGGIMGNLQTGTSRLLEQVGSGTRMSGYVCALIVGTVALANIDLLAIVPLPLVAGLVFYLGWTFVVDALWRPYVQRAWLDVVLAIGIMAVCVRSGYLLGVVVGVIAACLMFAISYARVGVMRRHLSRTQFSSYVDRSAEAMRHLRETGEAVQIYWLSGYIFFGSSEAILERIRRDVEALPVGRVKYVILDFGMVSGADSSTGASLVKLRHFCGKNGIALAYSALPSRIRSSLERGGFAAGQNQVFDNVNLAIAWCEDQLLTKAGLQPRGGQAGFEQWLQAQLGDKVQAADLIQYLDRKDTEVSQVLYRQGEPADTIDLIAGGSVAVDVAREGGEPLRVRRMTTHTVLGEMGFFRRTPRSATVSADAPATLYTLTRASFERMRRERPDLASAFDDFIIRTLADRVDFANRGVAALSPQRQ